MSSRVAKLKEELDAKLDELQEQQATVESIEKLTRELKAQKLVLEEKSAELEDRQSEAMMMQTYLDIVIAFESVIDNAMQTKSETEDAVHHVVERAIRSDHMSTSKVMQVALDAAIHADGRSRNDILDDFIFDLIHNEDNLDTVIESAIKNFDVQNVLEHTISIAMKCARSPDAFWESLFKVIDVVRGQKASTAESSEDSEVELEANTASDRQSQATPVNDSGLRGPAADPKRLHALSYRTVGNFMRRGQGRGRGM